MYLTTDKANAWADLLDDALAQSSRLTLHQVQFLGDLRMRLRQDGDKLHITSRQFAWMKHLASHASAR